LVCVLFLLILWTFWRAIVPIVKENPGYQDTTAQASRVVLVNSAGSAAGDSAAGPATGATTSVASSATPVTLKAANTARKGLTIFNDSTQVLYVLLGAGTVSSTVYTVQLSAGAYYEVPFGFSGAVTGLWASANGNARLTEITA
jgi:hypothetical protein